jgi:hypothetical protein
VSTVFTMPGKMGDALLQWPVVRAWLDQRGQSCELWVDEKTCSVGWRTTGWVVSRST